MQDSAPNAAGPKAEGGSPGDKEFMASLAKGLAVIQAFGAERPNLTLSQAAAAAGLSRAAARRVLLTLAELGYVARDGRQFALAAVWRTKRWPANTRSGFTLSLGSDSS